MLSTILTVFISLITYTTGRYLLYRPSPPTCYPSELCDCDLTPRGGRTTRATRHPLLNSTHYWEPQIDSRCQIHSINIYLGYKALDHDDILDFSVKLDNHVNNYTCQRWTLEGHYDCLTGNYTSNLINFYLSSNKSHLGSLTCHTNPRYIPHHISPHTEIAGTLLTYSAGIMLGSSQTQILQRIPTNCSCFLLHYNSGYGHAKAIKQLDGEWWDMNSEGPYPLTPPDWQLLQGHIYTLTTHLDYLAPKSSSLKSTMN